ncbi:MAG TPA: hypothetical protein VFA35_04575 [Burkholderiaceae bacterium]|nr:hypothetical protein [Burkholderiaceae bacterium]
MIVAVFDSVDVAEKAGRDFRGIEDKDEGFKIERGVLVQKDATGRLIVLDQPTRPFWASVLGAITGGLADHAIKDLLDGEWVASISGQLAPGAVVFVLQAQEASPFAIDNIVLGYRGTVFRKAFV